MSLFRGADRMGNDAIRIPQMPSHGGDIESKVRSLENFAYECVTAFRVLNRKIGFTATVSPKLEAGTNITLTQEDIGGNITIAASGGGSGNGTTVTVDFSTGKDFVRKTVTGLTWVTTGSEIVATVTGGPASRSVEEGLAEGLVCGIENIVDGDGFDLVVYSPNGPAYGQFNVFCVGV